MNQAPMRKKSIAETDSGMDLDTYKFSNISFPNDFYLGYSYNHPYMVIKSIFNHENMTTSGLQYMIKGIKYDH